MLLTDNLLSLPFCRNDHAGCAPLSGIMAGTPHNMNETNTTCETIMSSETARKVERVKDALCEQGSILIAFSGGVDSSVLAKLAKLAEPNGVTVLAATASSELLGDHGLAHARKVADEIGIEHHVFKFEILRDSEFTENTRDRCYHCKKHLIRELQKIAAENRIETIADGTNITDLAGDRPGYAAIRQADVFTPFVDFTLEKSEIRRIARYFGLSVADTPSESCFATRIPSGTRITIPQLSRIEKAESVLHAHGLHGVRVRTCEADHDQLAHIEIQPGDIKRFIAVQENVTRAFGRIGFDRVMLHQAPDA
ncbi:MAG: ATP-dependent sacrificial sulfur transferase LarE [Methanosarcinales archaeon]|nr:MAG: ATP-dependent sacrificial sulfur transferase LarE [Methanosarcinales archaeon]